MSHLPGDVTGVCVKPDDFPVFTLHPTSATLDLEWLTGQRLMTPLGPAIHVCTCVSGVMENAHHSSASCSPPGQFTLPINIPSPGRDLKVVRCEMLQHRLEYLREQLRTQQKGGS